MSRINERNYQLKLAFQDDDLRKPRHDEMMLWLDKWCRDANNMASVFRMPRAWKSRKARTISILDAESKEKIKASTYSTSILSQFKSDYPEGASAQSHEAWPDEPVPELRFIGLAWEPMLHNSHEGSYNRMIGFCDMLAHYEIDEYLDGVTASVKSIVSIEPEMVGQYTKYPKWQFVGTGTSFSFEKQASRRSLYFEVKTEIKSIGELMRQLQLYSSSAELAPSYSNARLVVVSPPHPEARDIVRSHGIPFIEFR